MTKFKHSTKLTSHLVTTKQTLLIAFISISALNCSKQVASTSEDSVTAAEAYCSNVSSYSSSVTASGSAQYQYRTNGNGAVNGTALPIRYAEIKVVNSSGGISQCGSTDASGNFSLTLPANSGSHTIYINSRADNSFLKAYVLDNPNTNAHYSVSSTVSTSAGSVTGISMTATATGTVVGAAFNILDQLAKTNDYLRAQVTTGHSCGSALTFTECSAFTVAPMVTAYWALGVNPGSYMGISNVVSFYVPGDRKLYLIGGVNGNYTSSDTDHFDNSVIIHEYGHFLEDVYGDSDSPGGSHNGDSKIDPRLAWSEGWADFIQAAVTYSASGSPRYRDTKGNPDGTPGVFFNVDIETGEDLTDPGNFLDVASATGEGIFREFVVARTLWDAIDGANDDTVNSADGMAEIWNIFAGAVSGFHASTNRFRNFGAFLQKQDAVSGKTDWSSIRTAEKTVANQSQYARTLTVGASCSTTMNPVTTSSSSFSSSDLQNNNSFIAYYHNGGTLSIGLTYTTTTGALADLDLYLYQKNYTYGSTSSILSSSNARAATVANCVANSACQNLTESVSTTLTSGWYMINVMAYTTSTKSGGATNFALTINSTAACIGN